MSWAEEMGYDAYTRDDILEFCWEDGYHRTKDGREIQLTDMTTEHLKNTIAYFKGSYNTKPLEKELKRRKLKSTTNR